VRRRGYARAHPSHVPKMLRKVGDYKLAHWMPHELDKPDAEGCAG
jgi:hypothetical protein